MNEMIERYNNNMSFRPSKYIISNMSHTRKTLLLLFLLFIVYNLDINKIPNVSLTLCIDKILSTAQKSERLEKGLALADP